jgi:RNA polymerase sigma-70 factor (ECF subfamily)
MPGFFPTTRWSVILGSRQGTQARRAALEHLVASYWKPVYVYVRGKGLDSESAKDAVQDVFTHLLERDFLSRLEPSRGRLRLYLKAVIDNYLVNRHKKQSALKRGGHLKWVPLELESVEHEVASVPAPTEMAFEREWALAVMERALQRLREEYDSGRRRGDAATMMRFFQLGKAPTYEEAATASDMSVEQFKARLHRARVRFRELVRSEITETVAGREDERLELADLLRILGS